MRSTIFSIFLLPLHLLGQQSTQFVDTVIVSGYFYEYAWKKPYRVPEWKGAYAGDFHFVSDSMLGGRTMGQYLQSYHNRVLDKEKFLSRLPNETFKPFEGADSATMQWRRSVIAIVPFKKNDKGHSIGVNDYGAWVTRATIRWIKLRVDTQSALHGFDRPATIDEFEARKKGYVYVYLPIDLLAIDRNIRWW